jgi:ribonucleoside-diphosphate reductase beta chain
MSTPTDKTEKNLLDPGFELTLRPMRYPDFYERYRDAIKNTWTVEEVDLHSDVADLAKLSPAAWSRSSRRVTRSSRTTWS